jgi:hypothetical protein
MKTTRRVGLCININTRRKVEACIHESGDVLLRWTKDRNKRKTIRLTRKAAEATTSLLIQILKNGNPTL